MGEIGNGILFTGGSVFDGTRFLERGTRVLVTGGQISAVGTDVEPGMADVVDLDGGTLLPGFIDSHAHPVSGGLQVLGCDLTKGHDSAAYLDIVARYAAANPALEWITGSGWELPAFPGGIPTRQALDSVVPGRPVFLYNRDHHGAWANSKALELAGIDGRTPDPADGRIERDADGEPVGMLQEGAMKLVGRLLPEITGEDQYRGLLAAQDYLLSLGVTGWQDAIVGPGYAAIDDTTDAYLRAASAGTLVADVVGAQWWQRDAGLEQLEGMAHYREHNAVGRFRPTSVKMMLDGIAENHTAAMLAPYLDHDGCATGNSGLDFIDPGELPRYVTALDQAGFQVHFHALGDRAVRNALNAIEAARAARPGSGRETWIRHHLAHLQVVHPDDIPRFAALGATANLQMLWAMNEPQMTELTIPFLPRHAITRRTALAAYTSGTARINGVAASAGSVKAGYDASFAVTDADLATIPDAEICQASVTQTWVRGVLA
jgi:predicted amidohydrolase YtcJ